jgi:hypothetical protein
MIIYDLENTVHEYIFEADYEVEDVCLTRKNGEKPKGRISRIFGK